MDFGVTEGALIILVLDRMINVIRLIRNGNVKKPNGEISNAELHRQLIAIHKEEAKQTEVLHSMDKTLEKVLFKGGGTGD